MKKYILLIILLCPCIGLLGQTQVHVYMNNGQQYKNVYLLEQNAEFVTINLNAPDDAEETLVKLRVENIRSIRFLNGGSKPGSVKNENMGFNKGIYYAIETGGMVGKSNSDASNSTTFMFRGSAGYSPVNYLGAGMGTGLDFYDGYTMLPVFLEFRGNLMESYIMPYYFVQTGYSAARLTEESSSNWVKEDIDGSWMFSSGLGVRVDTGKQDLIVSIGYKYQRAKIINEFDWEETTIIKREFNRVTFGFGIIF